MMEDRHICPAAVPEPEHPPLPGIAMLIALLGGGLLALILAGVAIAGGIGVILGVFS